MEDAEETYTQDSRRNEEEFLENLKEGKSTSKSEEIYKRNAERNRAKYKKILTKELNTTKKKKKKEEKKEKEKIFKVEQINLKTTWKDKLKFKIAITKFKISRRINSIFQKNKFNTLRYLSYRIKYFIKDLILNLGIIKTKLGQTVLKTGIKIKQTFNKTIELIVTLLKKVNFFRKKKKDGEENNKKDQKEGSSKEDSKKDSTKENNNSEEDKPTNNTKQTS